MSQTVHKNMGWQSFLASLALAEKAASQQCQLIARELRNIAREDLAQIYDGFTKEEIGHFELVHKLAGEAVAPNRALAIYDGELMSKNPSYVERMAVVHLAFEPSALAFLGHIHQYCDQYFPNEVVGEIKEAFNIIIKEEVAHIHLGKNMINELIRALSKSEKEKVYKSLRRHQAFLKVGLKSFFKLYPESKSFVQEMLNGYQTRIKNLQIDVA